MNRELTLTALAREILEGWSARQPDCSPRLRDYHRERLRLMLAEFGVEWHDVWSRYDSHRERRADEERFDATGLPGVMMRMPWNYLRIGTPYGDYLEYSFAEGEREVHGRHAERLAAMARDLKSGWVALFADLLANRFPEAAKRTTSEERLRALGLGPHEDPMDYF